MRAEADTTSVNAELVARAREVAKLLDEKAPEAEELRRLSPAVVEALREADLLSLGPPRMFGGHDVDLDTMFEVSYELGRGDASTAWVWMIWTLHAWFTGFAPQKAQEDVFGDGPDVIISSGYNPAGAKVERTDGGILLSGKWGFSSGVDYARWMVLGALIPGLERPPGAIGLLMLVPREEVTIVDDWYVAGLKATGSKSVVIEEPVFVPEHRYLDMHEAEYGPAKATHGRASYAVPSPVSMGYVVVAPFIGAAQTAIDKFAEEAKTRRDNLSGASKAQSVSLQMRIGESAAEIGAALALARQDTRALLDFGAREETLTVEQRATFRLHQVYAIELARSAVTRLLEISGTGGNWASSALTRRFMDVHAGSRHFSHRWDEYTESYGRVRLGLEPNALQQ